MPWRSAPAINTREGCRRVAEFAFDYAVKNGRKNVTCVHKANILKALTGLFLEEVRECFKRYADRITLDDRIIDACAMQLVLDPTKFDVILTTNLFGDILSDLIAGLVGGLGLAPGGNIGTEAAIFEAVHGSAPDIAGKGVANPTALLLAAAMMLDYVGESAKAGILRDAIDRVIRDDNVRTRDLGGTASTLEYTDALMRRIEARSASVRSEAGATRCRRARLHPGSVFPHNPPPFAAPRSQGRLRRRAQESLDEREDSPEVRRDHRHLQLRQHVQDPLHHGAAPARGSLLRLPSVLHGQAEDHGHGRARGEVPPALRPRGGKTLRLRMRRVVRPAARVLARAIASKGSAKLPFCFPTGRCTEQPINTNAVTRSARRTMGATTWNRTYPDALKVLRTDRWDGAAPGEAGGETVDALERGEILYFPQLPFELSPDEKPLLAPTTSDGKSKNVVYDIRNDSLHGTALHGAAREALHAMMRRYSESTTKLVKTMLPDYADELEIARTSFRPVRVEGTAQLLQEGRHAPARGCVLVLPQSGASHPARLQQREPRWRAPALGGGRAVRGLRTEVREPDHRAERALAVSCSSNCA